MFSERTVRRLADIVDDATRLNRLLAEVDTDVFLANELLVLAVERLLQRITEAVVHIGDADMALIAPTISARDIKNFGNFLRHQYADVDALVVLTVARENVPPLADAAARALEAK